MEFLQLVAIGASFSFLILMLFNRNRPAPPQVIIVQQIDPPNQDSFSAVIGSVALLLVVIVALAFFA